MSNQHHHHDNVHGSKSQSVTLEHIISYPFVADSLELYQQNPLGAKSIALAQSAYSTFAAPVVPYLQTPYSFISPYLAKADTLGNDALSRVDSHFPGLKKTDISTVKSHASAAASYPFKVAGEGKDYVFTTYEEEYKKTADNGPKGQNGIVLTGKAVICTEIRIAVEAMRAFADWIEPQKEKAEAHLEKAKHVGHEKVAKAKKAAHEKHEAIAHGN